MSSASLRELYLRLAVAAGAFAIVVTETLGAMNALTRPALATGWILALATAIWRVRLRSDRKAVALGFADYFLIAAIGAVLAIIAFVALLSPPNSSDAMAYHLPRVLLWAQQRSVHFFATPYLNQIMLQPFAEYLMLQTYILSGGDHFVNLVQWFGCVTSVIGVSLIAKKFGAGPRGQIIAALICVTLPNGILQASGAKNDYVMAGWLVAAAYFLLKNETISDAIFAGLALGLAIGTKATAYLYAAPLIVAIALPSWRQWRNRLAAIATIVLCALTLNLPQFVRNIGLSGSPLGFAGAFGDERFHWQNETFGWRQTLSNVIRHSTEQVAFRNPEWNQKLYDWAVAAHRAIGAHVDDPATTWTWSKYEPPRNANHETNTPNRWQVPLFLACFAALCFRREWRPMLLYAGALIGGFALFCFYLKWQPFMARMFLPLYVLASVIAGVMVEKIRPSAIPILLCLFLLNNARPYLFENWIRPLKGERSLLRTSRAANYFSDMTQWNDREFYTEAVDAAAQIDCGLWGIDTNIYQLEYPFEALLKERNPQTRFVHTAVAGPSAKYADAEKPCAVLCLNCAGDVKRAQLYSAYKSTRQFGDFLLFAAR